MHICQRERKEKRVVRQTVHGTAYFWMQRATFMSQWFSDSTMWVCLVSKSLTH